MDFEFRNLILMEKISQSPYVSVLTITKSKIYGFGIGYGIGRNYRPIRVSVSGRNQNSGFGRSLQLTHPRSVYYVFWLV